MKITRKILKWVGIVVGVIVLLAIIGVGVLTAMEFRPEPVEPALVVNAGTKTLAKGDSLKFLTFNVGYGGLGEKQDFFMDGGKMVQPKSKADVEENLAGITAILKNNATDIVFLQETDRKSTRSWKMDEATMFQAALGTGMMYATNFRCAFVPFPWPPIGTVDGGLAIYNNYAVTESNRVALPVPFTWPMRVANLKRCLLTQRIPLEEGNELVLVNLHLEAYDDGEGKLAQTAELMNFVTAEYEKGNYVIAGGDFNQAFPDANFPTIDASYWQAGKLDANMLPEGWQFAFDGSTPSCRLNNAPFVGQTNPQYYGIDGFILSPNVTLDEVKTLDEKFISADHNPVTLKVTLS